MEPNRKLTNKTKRKKNANHENLLSSPVSLKAVWDADDSDLR